MWSTTALPTPWNHIGGGRVNAEDTFNSRRDPAISDLELIVFEKGIQASV